MNLSDADRLREEDPFTGRFIAAVPTRLVVHRSRFEVDLNRERSSAVYRTPEQAWGLQVWKQPVDDAFVERSLSLHDHFYDEMRALLAGIEREHGAFVLLDVHSYNHRRDGATAPPTPSAKAPDINIGTFSMPVARWNPVLDALADSIRAFDFRGRRLEVGFNVAFEGRGALTRFVHQNFPQTGCAIAMEVKKFFMDEWSGAPFAEDIDALQQMIAQLLPVLQSALRRS
jgi:N-formylglutamate amidohydrolase